MNTGRPENKTQIYKIFVRFKNGLFFLINKIKPLSKYLTKKNLARFVYILIGTLIPLLYFYFSDVLPSLKKEKMNGEFNIAIAEFKVVDTNGKKVRSKDGYELSDLIFEKIESNFSSNEFDNINLEIWGPEKVDSVSGKTIEIREENAKIMSEKINADILVFGEIIISETSTISPEFYVDFNGFNEASEITGYHALGNPLIIKLPIDKTEFLSIKNPALSARIDVLKDTTIGLAYYSIDNFENALKYFLLAESIEGWYENAGKEIIYILIGNADVRLSSINMDSKYLNEALSAYEKAVQINPSYERAKVGLAGVYYLLALEDPKNNSINTKLLEHSETLFTEALTFDNAPISANIQSKAYFGLGQIFFLQSIFYDDQSALDKSKTAFNQVLNDYLNGNQSIKNLASHAYARLGLIEKTLNHNDSAILNYQNSIEIASPYYQCFYRASLADLYIESGSLEDAKIIYQEAIKLAEFYGFHDIREMYMTRIKEIN